MQVFLCPLSANVYNIDFVAFKIRAPPFFGGMAERRSVAPKPVGENR